MFGRKSAEIRILRKDLETAQSLREEALSELRAVQDEMARRAALPLPGTDWVILGSPEGVLSFRVTERREERETRGVTVIPFGTRLARVPDVTYRVSLAFAEGTQIVTGANVSPATALRSLLEQWERHARMS